jgi:hypothetical protein
MFLPHRLLLALLMPVTEGIELGKIRNERRKMMEEALVEFFFTTGATTQCGFVFCSPLSGYSLLVYEVT